MMVLISGPKDLNLISLNGDISTVDLLHLRGHFGFRVFPAIALRRRAAPRGAHPMCRLGPLPPCPTRRHSRSRAVSRQRRSRVVDPAVDAAPPPPTPPGF